jgi:hypothetical protein
VLDATPYLLQWLKKIVAHIYTDKTYLSTKAISIIGFIGAEEGYDFFNHCSSLGA